ncbi:MAG: hypothetical protein NTZ78_03605 [Candidatus Aureabacteria bacterium]|nr:hypothetical protein [Candidatus Auribacterota bacterium]
MQASRSQAGNSEYRGEVYLDLPDLKLFCITCDEIEPFNAISSEDFLAHGCENLRTFNDKDKTVQVFIFSFLCQGCKSIPETFMVRRNGDKLTLCGRAPMESLNISRVIPKNIQMYYRGAYLAYHSNQTLAGLFLLRTTIEQWARFATNMEQETKADKVLEKYMKKLPKNFKDEFPSMSSLYANLSADIHSATGSDVLFDRACEEIVEHFEARRLFKLKDK